MPRPNDAQPASKLPLIREARAPTAAHATSISRHARARMQQRGIARSAVDYLLDFGREYHDHHGAIVVMLDRTATARIARSGATRGGQLDALRGLYAVVYTDGRVRTVGHRTRRLRRA